MTQITVTQEDIRKGRPNDPCSCAVALAMERHGYEDVRVYATQIFIGACGTNTYQYFNSPPELTRFIKALDSGIRRSTMTFYFDPRYSA